MIACNQALVYSNAQAGPIVRSPRVAREIEWYAPVLKQAARWETSATCLTYLAQTTAAGFPRVGDGPDDGDDPRFMDDD